MIPFSDAFAPWLPTLNDIEIRKTDADPAVAAYYQKFGFDKLVVPSDCVNVTAHFADLTLLFNERYAFRMINKETLEAWQVRLQNNFDRIVRIYERAYVLYERYETELLDDMIEGETESIVRSTVGTDTGSGTVSGSDSSDSSMVNTPDYPTNAGDEYADTRSRSSGSSSRTSSDSSTSTVDETITNTKTKTGQSLIDAVNAGFSKWIDIDQAFIREFENNFLNIFWY